MRTDYKVLGNYIRLVDERNKDLSVTNLLGVSIGKKFIPSIANIVGTDLSSYKIVKTGQFAYGPVTSRNGEKISIAYLDGDDCIISSSYTVFEVSNKEELDPEYLMLWFSRPEFDRYARYKSHGSVREIFDWNELCMVELPVPDIKEQKNIVKAYKTITDRIALKKQINDNLEQQAQALYKAWFVDFSEFGGTAPNDWQTYHLVDFLPVITGKKNANVSSNQGKYPFFSCSQDYAWTDDYSFDGSAILVAGNGDFNVKFYSGKFEAYQRTYVLIPYEPKYTAWLFYAVQYHLSSITSAARGSVIKFITKGNLEDFEFVAPKVPLSLPVIYTLDTINRKIAANREENLRLGTLRDTLLPKLMSGEVDVSDIDL